MPHTLSPRRLAPLASLLLMIGTAAGGVRADVIREGTTE